MSLFPALLLLAAPAQEPKQLLTQALDQYRKLDSLSMEIEHQDSSGLFPGAYEQRLTWAKGNRFELVVTRKNPKPAKEPGRAAPDYYSDGKAVVTVEPDGQRSKSPLMPDANSMPGWEVSGGIILGWLVQTPASKLFFEPPAGFEIAYSAEPEGEWRGEKVLPLKLTMKAGQRSTEARIYLSADKARIVGVWYQAGPRSGWVHYKNQRPNAPVPAGLGDPPG